MTAGPESDEYAAGYADGVRDAAAWTVQRASRLLSLTGAALRAGVRELREDANTRWAQWSDRRNWPDVVARVRARRGRSGEGA